MLFKVKKFQKDYLVYTFWIFQPSLVHFFHVNGGTSVEKRFFGCFCLIRPALVGATLF